MISPDRFTLKQLRALDAVQATGAINRAAEALGLTPPAVHNQLKTLKDLLGCEILEKDASEGMRLTREGRVLLRAYRESRASLERAVHQIDALSKGLAGSVVLGTVSTAKYFAPGIVARLRREMPDVDLRLEVANRQETIAALAERRLDLCIMGRPPRAPRVTAKPLGDHPHVVVAPPGHPLAGPGPVDPGALLDEHFVMREPGSGTRILAIRYLDELGAGREISMTEMGSNETIKQAVISGLGIAMLSGHTVVEELRSGRLVQLNCPGTPIHRHWFMVELEGRELGSAARRVRRWILDNGPELLPHMPGPGA